MYRLLLETLLGVNREENQLLLKPSLPKAWTTFTVHYCYRQTTYHIRITRPPFGGGIGDRLTLDGAGLMGNRVPLVDDRREHFVEMRVA